MEIGINGSREGIMNMRAIQHRAEKAAARLIQTPEPDLECFTLLTFTATLMAVLATDAEQRQASQGDAPNVGT